jgi:serine/threonine protein kinase
MIFSRPMERSYPCSFGKYILLKPLAQGGMGELHLALTGEVGGFEKLCVLKRVRATRQNESAARRFLDEAKVVLKLSHGNLVQVFDAGFVDQQLYLAMEYVEGHDLYDILCRCDEHKLRIPTEVALYIAVQVCRGLDYAHTYGDLRLVHRDICPSNVLVSFSGEVKVTDFGLAQSKLKEEHTQPGKVFGRFAYLAPEQARRGEIDQRTDIYATSIILWELLVGQQMRPGPHNDAILALTEARAGKITPPSARNPRIPPEIDAIVIKGLQIEAERRYTTAEEMRRALAKVLVRLNPTFDTGGMSDFMRQVYGEQIEQTHQEREALLGRNYDRWRRPSSLAIAPRNTPRPMSGRRPGEVENLAGQVVDGRYSIIRLIGEGGMGAVYEAEHVEIGRRVAIKILHAIFSSHPETVARFRAEARAATRIGHPNIIEVTDSGTTDDGRVYFVMELLSGVDLARVMAEDRIVPAGRALAITLQICRALHAAHEAGIIHRDLKPENIFLTSRDGQQDFVKILDFGIAKNLELGQTDDRLTHPGIAMGTPEYMAPEQAAGKDVDRRIDVYATGALLYEMLTGHLPHEGDNLMQVLSKKASHPPPPPRMYRPDMPEELEQVILQALAADPGARIQTMAELGEALVPFAGSGDGWEATSEQAVLTSARDDARPASIATGPTSPLPQIPDVRLTGRRAVNRQVTGPGMPAVGLEPTLLQAAPARTVNAGQVRLSDDVQSEAHARIPVGERGSAGERQHQLHKSLAPTLMVPALRSRMWMIAMGGGIVVLLAVILTIVLWPRGDGKPVVNPGRADARARPAVKRDAAIKKPATQPVTRPATRTAKLTEEQVQEKLEWVRAAAKGGRYLKPKGDNVIELLDRIEEGYPEHPAAQQLRHDLCAGLKKSVAVALRKGRSAEAERFVQAWMALDPLSQETREPFFKVQLAQGRKALSSKRIKLAQQYAGEALKISPQSPVALELLGDIAVKRKRWGTAVEHYEAALKVEDGSAAQKKRLGLKLKKAQKRAR